MNYDDDQKRGQNAIARAIYREDVLGERIAKTVLPRQDNTHPAANRMIALDRQCRERLERVATFVAEGSWMPAAREARAWREDNAQLKAAKQEYETAVASLERHPEGRLYRAEIYGRLFAFPLVIRWSASEERLVMLNQSDYPRLEDDRPWIDLAAWSGAHGRPRPGASEEQLVWYEHSNGSTVLRNHVKTFYPFLPVALEAIRENLIPLGDN